MQFSAKKPKVTTQSTSQFPPPFNVGRELSLWSEGNPLKGDTLIIAHRPSEDDVEQKVKRKKA